MNNKLYLTLIFITFGSLLKGQDFVIGIKPSINPLFAKFIEEPKVSDLDLDSRLSYSIGLFGCLSINRFIKVQIEPRFFEKGWNTTVNQLYIHKNGYLSCPVLIKIFPYKKLSIDIGPDFSRLVYAKFKSEDGKTVEYGSPYKNKFELSIISGISYNIIKNYDIGARYAYGLTAFDHGTRTNPTATFKVYHSYAEIYLTIPILKIRPKD